jgi:hypothetical protein
MAAEFTSRGGKAMSAAPIFGEQLSAAPGSRHEQTELRLTVSPAFDHRGRRRHEAFEARLLGNTEVLCISRQPLLDAARVLLKRGMGPSTVLVMVYAVSPLVPTLKSSLVVAAAFDVMGMRFVRRKASQRPMPASPMRSSAIRACDQPQPEHRTVGAS